MKKKLFRDCFFLEIDCKNLKSENFQKILKILKIFSKVFFFLYEPTIFSNFDVS